MMRFIYKCILTIFFTTVLYGCVEDLDTDYDGSKKVVLNCLLTNDSIQHLTLSYSNPFGKIIYDEVTDAKVSLYLHGRLLGHFRKTSYMEWILKHKPWPNGKYDIVVEMPDGQKITASTTFPKPIIAHRVKALESYRKTVWEVEPSDVYWVYAFQKDGDTIMRPVVIGPNCDFLRALGTDNPNVDNFNLQKGNTDEAGKHEAYIRMLASDTTTTYSLYDIYTGVVVFCAVSDEYDKYLKSSLSKLYVYDAFDDPTQGFDESVIYSNVKNGLGIFGAYSEWLYNCNKEWPD